MALRQGFAGGLYDAEIGLVRFGARDYEPVVGRWVNKDPSRFVGGPNLYRYANGDPVDFFDANGRTGTAAALPIAAGAAAADGPLPVGDAIAAGLLICAALYDLLTDDGIVNIGNDGRELDRISRDLGIPRQQLRKALEKIKDVAGLRGNENVDVLPDGTVVDRVSGDPIGNIHDEQGD